jgi:RNA methyltransferase, TrmH family
MLLVPALPPQFLSSLANPRLKEIRRAVERGSSTRNGFCVAETFHLVEEALRSGCDVSAIVAAQSARAAAEHLAQPSGCVLIVVPDSLFRALAATETSQGVLALVRPPSWDLDRLFEGVPLLVVLDGLQDPGNAGAILRAAEAFSATGVLAVKGTVSLANPKAVRASAGSLFRVPHVTGLEPAELRQILAARAVPLYAAMPAAGTPASRADLTRPCALAIGSEGAGLREEFRAAARPLHIPIAGAESLNAAMAAGILLYEARRQRSL